MTFNLHAARAAAFWAAQAYLPAPASAQVLEDHHTETRVILHEERHHIVIAFRGTANVENWLEDLDVELTPLAYQVKVHAGFLKAVDALLPDLLGALLPGGRDKSEVKPLFIVGHSLGGAMATLAALFLQREGLPVHTVWTYGSPRVGNRAWRSHYQRLLGHRTWRIVAERDLVPMVPGLLVGYRHVGMHVMLVGYDSDTERRLRNLGIPHAPAQALVRPPRFCGTMLRAFLAARALASFHFDDLIRYHSITEDYQALLNTIV